MASKKYPINVTFAKELKLTASQISALEKAFKTDVAQVLGVRGADDPPFPEINISRPGRSSAKKKSAAKSKKR